ncbi:hypothetical protein F2P81_010792 [Scophthalmus maximus]|uniref:Peptidase A2 domain-containing protein n=1 Tax=Scophthalmus maximus TaxID=52904 RepID=A0A6A4T0T2_SCOMX|nr:hypothetical protein F2P81_010792 [Scophthalmus maximus]
METLPPDTRERYHTLRKALREEYSPFTDEASATLGAFAIMQKKHESPRDYYRRLRNAYFQGRNAPGLEEDHAFKSLFLHNLHECLRYEVTMHCRTGGLTMQEIKEYAQLAWETHMRPSSGRESDARVLGIETTGNTDLALESNKVPCARMDVKVRPQGHQPNFQQNGERNQRGGNQTYHQGPSKPMTPDPTTFTPEGKIHLNGTKTTRTKPDSRGPLPMLMPFAEPDPGSDPSTPPASPQPPQGGDQDSMQSHESFLCSLKNTNTSLYSPRMVGGVHINCTASPEALLALWSEKAAISQDLYNDLYQHQSPPYFAQQTHRLPSAETPHTPLKAIGVCAVSIRIGRKQVVHFVSVVPRLHPPVFVGADLLVRLGVQLDTVNQVMWSQANTERYPLLSEPDDMLSGQTIPQACQVASEVNLTIPARTAGIPIRLIILKGQKIPGTQAFFQPLPRFGELRLSVCGTPLLELNNRSAHLLVQNLTYAPVLVTARQPLGLLIDSSFHDFELTVPVIGELPPSVARDDSLGDVLFTLPTRMISITRHKKLQSEAICSATLGTGSDMVIYALVAQPGDASSTSTEACSPAEQPLSTFESEIDQQLAKTDVLSTQEQRDALRKLFHDFQHIFSKDSQDCGVTDLHTVRIPTDPNAQPTFVRQYRIPHAAYESIQEILDKLLQKQIIRECNSTYNSPIWPVLKPTGKWRLTIDYRPLNKQVPLFRWPMIHLDQELAKVKGACFFSTVDVANGF